MKLMPSRHRPIWKSVVLRISKRRTAMKLFALAAGALIALNAASWPTSPPTKRFVKRFRSERSLYVRRSCPLGSQAETRPARRC